MGYTKIYNYVDGEGRRFTGNMIPYSYITQISQNDINSKILISSKTKTSDASSERFLLSHCKIFEKHNPPVLKN